VFAAREAELHEEAHCGIELNVRSHVVSPSFFGRPAGDSEQLDRVPTVWLLRGHGLADQNQLRGLLRTEIHPTERSRHRALKPGFAGSPI
jgi:hypothetical protein